MTSNRIFWCAVLAMVTAMGTLEVLTALGETQVWDEGVHISAGYAYLTRGDYRWNPEHPPLAKWMSALPLLALRPELPVNGEAWRKLDEVGMGSQFLYQNRLPADSILFAARSITILLTLLFGLAFAWWMRRRFGPAAALLALCLYCFDPNLIAHGRYVTTDVPVAVFYFLACALWTDFLLSGQYRDLAAAALAFAVAMVAKFSAILLIPTFAILYGVRWWQSPQDFPLRRLVRSAAAVFGATFLVVNIVYWPETLRILTGNWPLTTAGSGAGLGSAPPAAALLARLSSHAFFRGLFAIIAHNAAGHESYLLGMRSNGGWWYYFPVVFAVKSTMAALIAAAFLAASVSWLLCLRPALALIPPLKAWRSVGPVTRPVRTGQARSKLQLPANFTASSLCHLERAQEACPTQQARAVPFVWIGLLLPPALYFAISTTSAINLGVRHLLPVYPFLYAAAVALLAKLSGKRVFRYAMVGLAALQIAECASIYPDYLAFFNALSGGPGNGPRYLVDSNIDWGQDVKKLASWLKARGTNRVWIGYFGKAEMRYYGLDFRNPPEALEQEKWNEIDGFVAASVTLLNGVYLPLARLAPLRLREPIAKVGYSIYVYDFRKNSGSP